MADRTLLRAGIGTSPPLAMQPGELAYSPDDQRLWLGDFLGGPLGALGVVLSDAVPVMDGTASAGSSGQASRSDHRHPTDTTRYAASNPAGYQTAANVTASIAAAVAGLNLDGGTF